MSILRKALTSTLAAAVVSGAAILAASSPAVAANYGGARFFAPASTFKPQVGQSGNVTFFGARPTTNPGHSGQAGTVTYVGGAKPYALPSHSGQVGNVTSIGPRPGMVAVPTIRTPNVVRVR